jgi:hypothetical protein
MTTPASGPISFANLNTEIGYPSGTSKSLNDAGVRYLGGATTPSSNTSISMSSLRGKTLGRVWLGPIDSASATRNFPGVQSLSNWETVAFSGTSATQCTQLGVFGQAISMAFWNGYYYSIFTDNTIKKSLNGQTWINVGSLPNGIHYYDIGYAGFPNGITYLHITDTSGNLYYSSDAINWSTVTITSHTLSNGITCLSAGFVNSTWYLVATGYDVTSGGSIGFWILPLAQDSAPTGTWAKAASLVSYAGSFQYQVGSMIIYNNQLVYSINTLFATPIPKVFYLDSSLSSWENIIDFSSVVTPSSGFGAHVFQIGGGNAPWSVGIQYIIFPSNNFSGSGTGVWYNGNTSFTTAYTDWGHVSLSGGQPIWVAANPTTVLLHNSNTIWASTNGTSWTGYSVSGATFVSTIVY